MFRCPARLTWMLSSRAVGRKHVVIASLCVLASCGAAEVRAPRSTRDRLDAAARELFAALTSRDAQRVHALQVPDDALGDLFRTGFVEVILSQRRIESRGYERISGEWSPFEGGRYLGYCARGVGGGVSSLPGLEAAVPAIGELVLAGRDAAGDWAGVVRDLVQVDGGYRLVRWTVDAPRRDHFELEQWRCDFGSPRP